MQPSECDRGHISVSNVQLVDNLGMLSFVRAVAGYARAMTVRPDTRYPAPTYGDAPDGSCVPGPTDYLLAMSVASASLPVIGKHLEPLGAATAMSIWGYRTCQTSSRPPHGRSASADQTEIRKQELESTNAVSDAALRGIVPAADLAIDWPAPERSAPVLEDSAAPPQPASDLGALRRPPVAVARRVAPQGSARRTGARDDLRARRRVDPRRSAAAGLRVDVPPGRAGLGVPVRRTTAFRRTIAGRSTSPM